MSGLIEISREELVRAFQEAQVRFRVADEALKSFRFSAPAKSEEFEEWKRLTEAWDERDDELQAAHEDLRDFNAGKLSGSSE